MPRLERDSLFAQHAEKQNGGSSHVPNYTLQGKILQPISQSEFEAALDKLTPTYQAYAVLIFYTGIRVSEALRLTKEDFRFDKNNMYVNVGIRLKTKRKRKDGTVSPGRKTEPLPLRLSLLFLDILVKKVKYTRKTERVFKFNRSTAWRQINKCGLGYNHRARLTAITFFLKSGYSIAHIVNWFGISVQTVNNYIGLIDMEEMGGLERV